MPLAKRRKGQNREYFLIHVCAWIVYGTFIYVANYFVRPEIKVINTVLFLLPFCFTFYVSVYFLGLYRRIGVMWSVVSFVIVFALMSLLGYLYMYIFLPLLGVRLYTSTELKHYVEGALLGYVQYFSYAVP